MRDGKLAYRETIVDGIENIPTAFAGLFRGENIGKMLVRVGPDDWAYTKLTFGPAATRPVRCCRH